ncbi:MAG: MerR family transcriptional regulator [Trebonia sp.]
MLMAELSRRSGVPVATIKYYLREGLLPSGEATSATRADYGEPHLRRLRLIRALLEIGEVPLAGIGHILATVDDESVGLHEVLGTVQYALGPHLTPPAEEEPYWQAARREVDRLIADLGWCVAADAPARTLLAGTVAALRRTGSAPAGAGLVGYAEALRPLADLEVASLDAAAQPEPGGPDHPDRVGYGESAVVGIVLYERVIIALRRLAQEDASARYFGDR